jgi:hypothetical protein
VSILSLSLSCAIHSRDKIQKIFSEKLSFTAFTILFFACSSDDSFLESIFSHSDSERSEETKSNTEIETTHQQIQEHSIDTETGEWSSVNAISERDIVPQEWTTLLKATAEFHQYNNFLKGVRWFVFEFIQSIPHEHLFQKI